MVCNLIMFFYYTISLYCVFILFHFECISTLSTITYTKSKTPSYLLTILVSFELEQFLFIAGHYVLNQRIVCVYQVTVFWTGAIAVYTNQLFWIQTFAVHILSVCFELEYVLVYKKSLCFEVKYLLFIPYYYCFSNGTFAVYTISLFSVGAFVNYITGFWTESFDVYTISLCLELEHLLFILYHCAPNNRICCLWLCQFKLVAKEYLLEQPNAACQWKYLLFFFFSFFRPSFVFGSVTLKKCS